MPVGCWGCGNGHTIKLLRYTKPMPAAAPATGVTKHFSELDFASGGYRVAAQLPSGVAALRFHKGHFMGKSLAREQRRLAAIVAADVVLFPPHGSGRRELASLVSRIENYIRRGRFYVDGWLHSEVAPVIVALTERQRSLDITGGIAEIGVHHGKLFILLYLLSREPEKAVAIDLFEDQHLNIDRSGRGDLAKFRRNLDRYADSARLVLHQGNSMVLTGAILTRLAEGPLRFVSVDGGHTAAITAHDLATSEAAIGEGGIIVVDDVFNEQWPGVGDGVRRYFERRPNLVPFAIGANKTYFCRPSHREIYHDTAAAAASTATATEFLGKPVAFLQFLRPGLKDRVAELSAWQRLRTTAIGLALRWAWHTGRTLRRGLTRKED